MFYQQKIAIVSLILFIPTPAFAYLDPSSGSMLFYFLVGVFATLIYSIKNLFFRVKVSISRLFSKGKVKLKDKKNIVFYSEGGHYWPTFEPVIEALSNMGIECSYYTSDSKDEGLKFQAPTVDTLFIGDSQFSFISLNYLEARILVMTTPQIDVMHLKRSKDVDYFVHLIHSPIDVFKYRPFSFDLFDCIMCSGQYQIDHLRMIEEARSLPPKNLLMTGLVYFDELLKSKKVTKPKNKQKTILVAPTWGRSSLLNKVGFKPLQLLIDAGFKVILRPHPQSFASDVELIKEIESKCDQSDAITIDKSQSAQKSMERADVMVSDVSGIIFDFAFIYEKPVVTFSAILDESKLLEITKVNDTRKDEDKVQIWEVEKKSDISTEINIAQVDNLPGIVNQALSSDFVGNIRKLRDESIFNYGYAGKVAAKQLVKLLDEV